MQASYFSGGEESPPSHELAANAGGRPKRKRGRPRKYSDADGPAAFGMLSAQSSSSQSAAQQPLPESGFSQPPKTTKKKKDRTLGFGKKLQMNALGSSGIGFTPHVIAVKAGEDVSAKIMSFSNSSPRAICVLSANGAISTVQVRHPAASGGTSTYEGRYEILSLTGSILPVESSTQHSRTGGLSVSLAGPDGHVLGGGVAGHLIAATPVQVVVGSFISDSGRKERQPMSPPAFEPAPEKVTQDAPLAPPSPNSRGLMSESSEGGHRNPYNDRSNGHEHRNGNEDQGFPFMAWR